MTEGELLTVSDVAKRLGLHEKQVRRYASRLNPPERTGPDVSPLLVSLSAIERERNRTAPQSVRVETGQDTDGHRQDTPDSDRPAPSLTAEQTAILYERLLQEKDARIQTLESALHFAQETAQEYRAQLSAREATKDTGQDSEGQAGHSPAASPSGTEGTPQADSGREAAEAETSAGKAAQGQKRRWWQLWKG